MLRELLAHPLARGVDLDDPQATVLRRRILREKKFLRLVYEDWYKSLTAALPPGPEPVLELGTGAGFLKDYVPGLITSDVLRLPDLDVVLDAHEMPFADGALKAIVMIDVLHHLPKTPRFFSEASRCVRPGGAMVMIEPWVTPWSQQVYTRLHHEPFLPHAEHWEFPPAGPLSGANGALPWIIFHRDRSRFTDQFPEWGVKAIELDMPLSYLLSGGVSMRAFMPGFAFRFIRGLEGRLGSWMDWCAMFAGIRLERTAR